MDFCGLVVLPRENSSGAGAPVVLHFHRIFGDSQIWKVTWVGGDIAEGVATRCRPPGPVVFFRVGGWEPREGRRLLVCEEAAPEQKNFFASGEGGRCAPGRCYAAAERPIPRTD